MLQVQEGNERIRLALLLEFGCLSAKSNFARPMFSKRLTIFFLTERMSLTQASFSCEALVSS